MVPGVLYGPDRESVPVSVQSLAFDRLFSEAGSSALVDATYNNEAPVKVLIQDVQLDPVTDRPVHVDFRQIKMGEKMSFTVPVEFIGESEAVEALSGTLVKNITDVEINCLPKDLVATLEVDLAKLATFEDALTVADLSVPEGIEILSDESDKLAYVEAPRTEEEIAALEAPVEGDVADVEVDGEKAEGEAGDEGDAAEKKKDDAPAAEEKSAE